MEYKKVSEQINDIVGDKVKALAQVFPSAVKDGEVDFTALKEELGQFKEVGHEKYELTWAGKQKAKKLAQEDIVGRTLKFIHEDSKNADTTENLYIEGDNLEVLKLLRQNYYGAIKMIYIDPPYNTGNDFIYNDSFNIPLSEYEKEIGSIDINGTRMVRNQSGSGRFHSDWCSMIYTRLKIARDFLEEDGAIFISIDDKEVDNLLKICNEIYGEENFVGCISRATGTTTGQDANKIGSSLDYCVVYAKSNEFMLNGIGMDEKDLQRFKDEDNKGKYSMLQLRKTGSADTREERPNMFYPVIAPDETEVYPFGPTNYLSRWRVAKETYDKLVQEDKIVWKKNSETSPIVIDGFKRSQWTPYVKYYLEGRTKQVSNLFQDIEGNKKASLLLKELFGNKGIFDNPKPLEFIKILIQIATNSDDYVMDFFAGSSTTAHAIMTYNSENKSNRKFILVQLPEQTDEKSEAYKQGYKTICDIGKERIRRAGDKIKQEHPEADIDIGFKVFRTADSNIKWNSITDFGQLSLELLETTPDEIDFVPGANDIDIVYELMLRQRDVALSETLETLTDIGSRTYLYASSFLVCLETEITENLIFQIAEIDPLPIKFIFRDSAFKDDIALKDETFRRLKALVEKNAGTNRPTYTVEFI